MTSDQKTAAGCFVLVAEVCSSVAAGMFFGAAYGVAAFAALMAINAASAYSSRGD